MSRAGYYDDCDDPLAMGRWRAAVRSAMRGKRGQAFLKEALAVLDAMPDKRLIAGHLVVDGDQCAFGMPDIVVGGDVLVDKHGAPTPMGAVCLLGAVGQARGLDMSDLDPEDMETVAPTFGLADAMARELVYWNDEGGPYSESPEHRWQRMREWISNQIIKTAGDTTP
jgi:hypothetical protein